MIRSTRLLGAAFLLLGAQACQSPSAPRNYTHVVVQPAEGQSDIGSVPPPFTAAETTALRQGFDWAATTPLAETDENGNPALYYTLLLVKDRDTWNFLQLTGFAIDPFPLFDEELSRWNGQVGYMDPEGDDEGTFVFGIIPGVFYNWLRTQALANDTVVSVALLRDPPDAAATLPGGSLSYSYLASVGFTGASSQADEIVGPDESVGSATGPLQQNKLRWLRRIANAFRAVVNVIRQGIAAVRIALGQDRDFRVHLRVMNVDPAFLEGAVPDPNDDVNLMRSAWREPTADVISLDGAKIDVGKNAWARTVTIDRNNSAHVRIPASQSLRVWLRLTTRGAEILRTNGVFNRRIMLNPDASSPAADPDRTDDVNWIVTLRTQDTNLLAQFTDDYEYMHSVVGVNPPRAVVPHLPAERESFTGCLSMIRWELISLTLPTLILPLGVPDWDILIQNNDAGSRLIPSHEYGHFASCTLLQRTSHAALLRGMTNALSSVISDRSGNAPARALTEGFADFFASQAAGGVNYFGMSMQSGRYSSDAQHPAFYCDVDLSTSRGIPCMEDNILGPIDAARASVGGQDVSTNYPVSQVVMPQSVGTAQANSIAWVVTLMTDAFDGSNLPNAPRYGSSWAWDSPRNEPVPVLTFRAPEVVAQWQFVASDEDVILPGRAFGQLFDTWWHKENQTLNSYTPMFNALARVSLSNGFTQDEVCQMFERHSLSGNCRDLAPVLDSALLGSTTRAIGATVSPVGGAAYTPYHGQYLVQWFSVGSSSATFHVELLNNGVLVESGDIAHSRVASWMPGRFFNCLSEFSPNWTVRITPFVDGTPATATVVVLPLPFCIE